MVTWQNLTQIPWSNVVQCNHNHHRAAQANHQCSIIVVYKHYSGSTVTKAQSTKTKAFSLKAMLVLLVSQPGACPGLRTPSPSRTPTRPSAPDALFDSWPRTLCSSTFFVWKRKVLVRISLSGVFISWEMIKSEAGVQWWGRCELGQTEVIAVLRLLLVSSHNLPRLQLVTISPVSYQY